MKNKSKKCYKCKHNVLLQECKCQVEQLWPSKHEEVKYVIIKRCPCCGTILRVDLTSDICITD